MLDIMSYCDFYRSVLHPEKPVYQCDHCKKDIYDGEDYYAIGDEIICEGCISDFRRTAEAERPGDRE